MDRGPVEVLFLTYPFGTDRAGVVGTRLDPQTLLSDIDIDVPAQGTLTDDEFQTAKRQLLG
jgi:hypothetical protein